jgi:hypothetical protein
VVLALAAGFGFESAGAAARVVLGGTAAGLLLARFRSAEPGAITDARVEGEPEAPTAGRNDSAWGGAEGTGLALADGERPTDRRSAPALARISLTCSGLVNKGE